MGNTERYTGQLQSQLDRLRAGDKTARDEIINHSCERLRRLTRKMLRGYPKLRRWEQTDDILQNALLRLHRSLAKVQPESVRQFLGLSATQIRRSLIDLARHHFGPEGQGAHHHTDVPGNTAAGPVLNHPALSDEPASLEAWTEFHEAVEHLEEAEREVFNIIWYEGLTQTEAASILGVNERTVRRRWQSARVLLFESLNGDHPK
jgi:RNA polymerase sigma factor (sigma-70 family)